MAAEDTRAGEHFKNEMEAGMLIGRSRLSPSWLFVLPAILLGASLRHGPVSAEPPCPIGGPAEVHYAPGEDLERIDVALLREAAKQIDMAAYVLTDRAVIAALREPAARGVKVRIWRDANMAERVGDVDVEAQLGGRVQSARTDRTACMRS
jgi:phosphatidylserine/phosphatidylglycerophosphate/cardiolipin synthase-like enzyme